MDFESGKVVPTAIIAVASYVRSVDDQGKVDIPVTPGKVKISVYAEGYKPLQTDVLLSGDASVVLSLEAKPEYEEDF